MSVTALNNSAAGIYTLVPAAPSGMYPVLKTLRIDHSSIGSATIRTYPASGTMLMVSGSCSLDNVGVSGAYGKSVEIELSELANVLCNYVYVQPEGLNREPNHSYGGHGELYDSHRRTGQVDIT